MCHIIDAVRIYRTDRLGHHRYVKWVSPKNVVKNDLIIIGLKIGEFCLYASQTRTSPRYGSPSRTLYLPTLGEWGVERYRYDINIIYFIYKLANSRDCCYHRCGINERLISAWGYIVDKNLLHDQHDICVVSIKNINIWCAVYTESHQWIRLELFLKLYRYCS